MSDVIPKPLLPIGKKPILEVIIERLGASNFTDIILTVEYKAELIKAYFRNGHGLDVNITYFHENKPSGTAGPLKLIDHLLEEEPFLAMNGDLLTNLDFGKMYQAHLRTEAELTMATATHTINSPYGVVELTGNNKVASIREKPELKFLINAGIYVVSTSVLDIIPEDKFFDMPDLIQTLINQGRNVKTYHINGEWHDLGTMETYQKINALKSKE